MRRTFMIVVIILTILSVFTSGCTAFFQTACSDAMSTPNLSTPLPDINSFSSTEYDQTAYMFPRIKSAVFVHDGICETLNPEDPRLIRLLNSLSFSYTQ